MSTPKNINAGFHKAMRQSSRPTKEVDGVDIPSWQAWIGQVPDSQYPGHVMQLAAYCYLIERCDRRSVCRGILRYPETSFEISYTIELRRRLLATLEALRKAEAEGYPRTHRDFTKCRGCGYRSHCDERLRS